MLHSFEPSRDAARQTLTDFVPKAALYASRRNFDPGPERVADYPTSRLSPYLRLRLMDEEEVVRTVLSKHPYPKVEKFIQEVFWRTYWKGWLEMRPDAWNAWIQQIPEAKESVDPVAYHAATCGKTGIACFDAWVDELRESGYLHNHTRMWFASIWIFTLGLPWSLGAAFFEEHLFDGDPASNLLSWKWVAGLQTKGKHYLARATNISRYTEGRWNPDGTLNESAHPLTSYRDYPRRPFSPPGPRPTDTIPGPIGYLCHPEDLGIEWDLPATPQRVAWGWTLAAEKPVALTEQVRQFRSAALEATAHEMGRHHGKPVDHLDTDRMPFSAAVLHWARSHQIKAILTPFAPVGGWQSVLGEVARTLAEAGIEWIVLTRDWDRQLYPRATHGFFRFRKTIPEYVRFIES